MPAARAPGSSVSPNASIVCASSALSRRNGTPCARASRADNEAAAPPIVNANTPVAVPFRKSRRSLGFMVSSPAAVQRLYYPDELVAPADALSQPTAAFGLDGDADEF